MKLAAIDIGSNAIRLQIVKVFKEDNIVSFKKLEFLRFPLRLGADVFKVGEIGKNTIPKFVKLMGVFKSLMDLYEVDAYTAVATSAMREAKNGEWLSDHVKSKLGLKIDIISGQREAKIINKALFPYLKEEFHIHVDVGGGSTELNYYEGTKLISSKSFKIGSVRKLNKEERAEKFDEIKQWMSTINITEPGKVVGVGTGGNINKLFKLSNKSYKNFISLVELKAIRAYVKEFSTEDRMTILKMNPDRADVIIPASKIYINVLEQFDCDRVIVPQVGLKDGLIYELYEMTSGEDLSRIEFI